MVTILKEQLCGTLELAAYVLIRAVASETSAFRLNIISITVYG